MKKLMTMVMVCAMLALVMPMRAEAGGTPGTTTTTTTTVETTVETTSPVKHADGSEEATPVVVTSIEDGWLVTRTTRVTTAWSSNVQTVTTEVTTVKTLEQRADGSVVMPNVGAGSSGGSVGAGGSVAPGSSGASAAETVASPIDEAHNAAIAEMMQYGQERGWTATTAMTYGADTKDVSTVTFSNPSWVLSIEVTTTHGKKGYSTTYAYKGSAVSLKTVKKCLETYK